MDLMPIDLRILQLHELQEEDEEEEEELSFPAGLDYWLQPELLTSQEYFLSSVLIWLTEWENLNAAELTDNKG